LANLFLLFWLSLVPFIIRWMGETGFMALPTAAYGVVAMAAIGYTLLQWTIVASTGRSSTLAAALGSDLKGKLSISMYVVAIPLAFVSPWIAIVLYVAIALTWFVPDRRIEPRSEAIGAHENTWARQDHATRCESSVISAADDNVSTRI
jgi:uncharacterized membrane protein